MQQTHHRAALEEIERELAAIETRREALLEARRSLRLGRRVGAQARGGAALQAAKPATDRRLEAPDPARDGEGEPEDEPLELEDVDVFDDPEVDALAELTAPAPRRGPGRPQKTYDPKLRQVDEKKKRAAAAGTEPGWWTRPLSREEFRQRAEALKDSPGSRLVRTPVDVIGGTP